MPWTGSSGAQLFQRTDGTRTGSNTWSEADAAGIDIVAPDHDLHDQDIADGLTSCLKKDRLMSFDDLMSEEEKSRIRAIIAALEAQGFKEARTISVLIGAHCLTIHPNWLERFGNRAVAEIAACIHLGLLETLCIVPDEALFLGGPAIDPKIYENPDLIFDVLVPPPETMHEPARA